MNNSDHIRRVFRERFPGYKIAVYTCPKQRLYKVRVRFVYPGGWSATWHYVGFDDVLAGGEAEE